MTFYPSALCWFEKNGKLPHENYTNHLEMITRIMQLNQQIFMEQRAVYAEENDGVTVGDFSSTPKFHIFGVRNRKHRMDGMVQGEKSQQETTSY